MIMTTNAARQDMARGSLRITKSKGKGNKEAIDRSFSARNRLDAIHRSPVAGGGDRRA